MSTGKRPWRLNSWSQGRAVRKFCGRSFERMASASNLSFTQTPLFRDNLVKLWV